MRWYNLVVGSGSQKYVFQSSPTLGFNATPLNISFSIRGVAGLHTQVTNVIKIYNVNPSMFMKLRDLVGKPLLLEAGFDDKSNFIRKLGYSKLANKTLVLSKVQSVFSNFDTSDTWVAISTGAFGDTPKDSTKLEDLYNEIDEKPYQTEGVALQVSMGEKVAEKIAEVLKFFFKDQGWGLVISASAQIIVGEPGQSLQIAIKNIAQLIWYVRERWGLALSFDSTNRECYCYKAVDESDIAGLSKRGVTPVTITSGELLSQPQVLGINQRTIVTVLRPDIHIGTMVALVGTIPLVSQFQGIDEFVSQKVMNSTAIFAPGIYMVNAIQHSGNFYGSAPDSWSSQMTLTEVDLGKALKNVIAKRISL